MNDREASAPDPVEAADPPPGYWVQPPEMAPDLAPGVAPEVAPAGRRPVRGLRLVTFIALLVVGIGAVAGGGTLLARELTRPATRAEVAAASSQEIATRWQRLTAGAIFPATVGYQSPEGSALTATLIGIAPRASCASALDPKIAAAVRPLGCEAVLRATYVDASGTLVATVGFAVMSSAEAANRASSALTTAQTVSGIRAATFSGTPAATFGDRQRASFAGGQVPGPYLFFFAAGYADGRVLPAVSGNPDLSGLGDGVMGHLETILTNIGKPCEMKDMRC